MKIIISLILFAALLVTLLPGCSAKEKAEGSQTAGGWAIDGTEMTDETKDIFNKAFESLLGVTYNPLMLMGRQLVNGTNYEFLAEATVVSPDQKPYLCVITIHKSLDGEVSILNIQRISVSALTGDEEEAPFTEMAAESPEAAQGAAMGGWTVAVLPMKDADAEAPEVKAFAASELAAKKHVPLFCLAYQVVAGTNYCYLAVSDTGFPELVYLYADLEGNVSVSDCRTWEHGSFTTPAE